MRKKIYVNDIMNQHTEAALRIAGVFLSVFFTTRWTSKSEASYDLPLVVLAVAIAIFLNINRLN